MARQRNFLPLAGFLVCGIAFISYPAILRPVPGDAGCSLGELAALRVGLGLVGAGLVRAFRQPERYRGRICGPDPRRPQPGGPRALPLHDPGYARQLPASAGAPKVGEKAPDFTLPDSQGKPVRLSGLLETGGGAPGSWVLLIFYRGYW